MKTIVSFAGVDPSGGAGIYVDLRVIAKLGFHPAGVVTVVTYQNTCGIEGMINLRDLVERQAEAIFEDLDVVGVKVGLVLDGEVVKRYLESVEVSVVDPVLVSTTGYDFGNIEAYRILANDCDVITPNADEAKALVGWERELTNIESAKECAKEIARTYGCDVVITGGKLGGRDVVYDGSFRVIEEKLEGYEVHGTGCVYSTALTCYLAKGFDLYEACRRAREFVHKAVLNSVEVGRCLKVVEV